MNIVKGTSFLLWIKHLSRASRDLVVTIANRWFSFPTDDLETVQLQVKKEPLTNKKLEFKFRQKSISYGDCKPKTWTYLDRWQRFATPVPKCGCCVPMDEGLESWQIENFHMPNHKHKNRNSIVMWNMRVCFRLVLPKRLAWEWLNVVW